MGGVGVRVGLERLGGLGLSRSRCVSGSGSVSVTNNNNNKNKNIRRRRPCQAASPAPAAAAASAAAGGSGSVRVRHPNRLEQQQHQGGGGGRGGGRGTTSAAAATSVWRQQSGNGIFGSRSRSRSRTNSFLCRADPRRIARLEKQFARELSNLLCYDEVLLNAMSPYREYMYEEDLMMAEVTEVVISNDLQVCKVYVYFSGDDADSRMFAFENLQRKVGYIRKELSQKVKMRRAPEVRLIYDKAIEEQERVDEIFAKLRRERAEGTTPQ